MRPSIVLVRAALAAWLLVAATPVLAQPREPAAPADPPVRELRYRFHGYLRLEGTVVQNDPLVAFVGRNDGFTLANARVGISGQWRDRVTFKVSADGAEDEREGANATEGRLRFALKDAYADLAMARAAGLRAGQFYAVFDLEETTAHDELAFVDRALESRGVRATEGWETPGLAFGRSLGVALRAPRALGGEAVALGYELALQNGTGENESANDNDALAYSAALWLGLPGDSRLGIAGRHNRRSVGAIPFKQTEEDLSGSVFGVAGLGPVRLEGQLLVRRTTFPTTGTPEENAIGGHAQAMWRIPLGRLELAPGYRFAVLDPSDLITTDLVQEHTLGVNVGMPDLRARLQLNATHTVEEAGRALENDRVELLLQVGL